MQAKRLQKNRKNISTPRDNTAKLRLLQLVVSLGLFLCLYVGQGIFPDKMGVLRADIAKLVGADTDFKAWFTVLGQSISEDGTIFEGVENAYLAVFGTQQTEAIPVFMPLENLALDQREGAVAVSYYLGIETLLTEQVPQISVPEQEIITPQQEQETITPQVVIPVGSVLVKVPPTGTTLPENHSLDKLSLGELEFTAPMTGKMTSPYGPRVSPTEQTSTVHSGVDLVGSDTLEIVAFADGVVTVATLGRTAGLYIRIDHGNEIGTLYAHCSELLVEEGQAVKMGEVIAIMGETGDAVGAHLHFELTCNGIYLNPLHYFDYA